MLLGLYRIIDAAVIDKIIESIISVLNLQDLLRHGPVIPNLALALDEGIPPEDLRGLLRLRRVDPHQVTH